MFAQKMMVMTVAVVLGLAIPVSTALAANALAGKEQNIGSFTDRPQQGGSTILYSGPFHGPE